MKHEKKDLNYPDGDIPTTNCEKEKRSRASRNVKVPYDPTSATDNQPRRGRLLFMSSDEEETPRAPTLPLKKKPSSTIEKTKVCGRQYTNEKGNRSFISSSGSKLLSVSTDEEKTTRDPNPPLVVKKGKKIILEGHIQKKRKIGRPIQVRVVNCFQSHPMKRKKLEIIIHP